MLCLISARCTNTDLSLFSVHGDQRQHEWRGAPSLAQGGSCGCCCCILLLLLLQIRSVLQVPCYSTAGLGWLSLVAAAVMVVTAGVAAAGYRQLQRCSRDTAGDTCPDTGTRAAETTGPVELGRMDVSVISEHYWGVQSSVMLQENLQMNIEPEIRSSQQYPGGACLRCLPPTIHKLLAEI